MNKPPSSTAEPAVKGLNALSYSPETGYFTFLVSRGTAAAGSIAGTVCRKTGYRTIRLCGKSWRANRLAWVYVHGVLPSGVIDHINGARDDNRIENLRDVPTSMNSHNIKGPTKKSTHGYLGAHQRKDCKTKRWVAKITVNHKHMHIGSFGTPEEAQAAYLVAKRQLHAGNTL
jgi:hypothetical protein